MDLQALFEATRRASRELAAFAPAATDALLRDLADATVAETPLKTMRISAPESRS